MAANGPRLCRACAATNATLRYRSEHPRDASANAWWYGPNVECGSWLTLRSVVKFNVLGLPSSTTALEAVPEFVVCWWQRPSGRRRSACDNIGHACRRRHSWQAVSRTIL